MILVLFHYLENEIDFHRHFITICWLKSYWFNILKDPWCCWISIKFLSNFCSFCISCKISRIISCREPTELKLSLEGHTVTNLNKQISKRNQCWLVKSWKFSGRFKFLVNGLFSVKILSSRAPCQRQSYCWKLVNRQGSTGRY